mmetsp:Transcript_24327/g.54857  ORF Transcript_24327/g.54857 Transcript_24327/m.54857 type:complete len:227 (+) Transcript_24327:99-779(+)
MPPHGDFLSCLQLSGIYEGESVPDGPGSDATVWGETSLVFLPDGPGIGLNSSRLLVKGRGVSLWRGRRVRFLLDGFLDGGLLDGGLLGRLGDGGARAGGSSCPTAGADVAWEGGGGGGGDSVSGRSENGSGEDRDFGVFSLTKRHTGAYTNSVQYSGRLSRRACSKPPTDSPRGNTGAPDTKEPREPREGRGGWVLEGEYRGGRLFVRQTGSCASLASGDSVGPPH